MIELNTTLECCLWPASGHSQRIGKLALTGVFYIRSVPDYRSPSGLSAYEAVYRRSDGRAIELVLPQLRIAYSFQSALQVLTVAVRTRVVAIEDLRYGCLP